MLADSETSHLEGVRVESDKESMATGKDIPAPSDRLQSIRYTIRITTRIMEAPYPSSRCLQDELESCLSATFSAEESDIIVFQVLTTSDSSPIEKDKIFKPASVCYMTMALQRLHPNKRSVLPMESFTFRRVSLANLTNRGCSN
jgi:hypothetical protein